MRRRLLYLIALLLFFLIVFALWKVAFMLYNHAEVPFTPGDVAHVLRAGFTMDLSTSAYLLIVPWLALLLSLWWKGMPLRLVLAPYFAVVGIVLSLTLVGDTVMYRFWHFKLDNTVFLYLHDTAGATNSVSPLFIIGALLIVVIVALVVVYTPIRLTPHRLTKASHRILDTLVMLVAGGIVFVCMRGGTGRSNMNVGVAYFSPTLFLNHSAVNPAFNLVTTMRKNRDFARQFQYLPHEQCASLFEGLYPSPGTDDTAPTDTLLRLPRPNVLIVLMESFGGSFVEKLGGAEGVAPCLSALIPEGVFFTQFYANSFRTDRGTVSTLSGWLSYPTLSLMRIPGRSDSLPSIASSLGRAGYRCGYLYGGDIKIMGKRGYLVATGYQWLTSIDDFPLNEEYESKWGVNDSISALRLVELIRQQPPSHPWHIVYQTLSSHEPWQVPYSRLSDPILNAFAFTDHCIGQLIDSLRTLPSWDNTLVILLPDHNASCMAGYERADFFRCPMLWLGGAVREPRTVDVLMNQSDLAATLLAQMGLPHEDFPWSRNVFSPSYTYPFVYSSFPAGVMFKDSTGATVFDITSDTPLSEQPSPSPERVLRAKAILETSYQRLTPH